MFERIIKMFTRPYDYWNEAIAEPGDIKSLLVPQMLILAAIPAVASFLGIVFTTLRFGMGAFSGAIIAGGLISLILGYAMNIGMWIAFGYIIDALAAPFGAQKDIGQSMKLAAGGIIPVWLGGALNLIPFPGLGFVGMLAGLGYGIYLLYLGLPVMNGTSKDKAVGFAIAAMGILLVAMIIIGILVSCPVGCLTGAAAVRGAF